MAYPHKWSPISYKSSAGQRKHIGQRPMLYRRTTQPTTYKHTWWLYVVNAREIMRVANWTVSKLVYHSDRVTISPPSLSLVQSDDVTQTTVSSITPLLDLAWDAASHHFTRNQKAPNECKPPSSLTNVNGSEVGTLV